MKIEFRSGELLGGSVVWEDECDVGILFPRAVNVAAVLASRWTSEKGKRRALPRISVECPGQLNTGVESLRVLLQDISQGGASVEIDAEIPRVKNVRLTLPDLPPIAGVVRWVCGTKIGVSFDQHLAFEMLARWIQARREGLGLNGRDRGRTQAPALGG